MNFSIPSVVVIIQTFDYILLSANYCNSVDLFRIIKFQSNRFYYLLTIDIYRFAVKSIETCKKYNKIKNEKLKGLCLN